ncbi:hypothetical protein MLD38_001736 [Melastoma candidum]|uniref:Uncharacterized protein n=1 Tax=Melastoma candidum TaxID=119954 RepID=A0ACB9SEB1_9MYRT|nr:hypothetical protein MLD38_001736 [Melastoma candidum]
MERKQHQTGFFSSLKDEVVRGLSPGKSRSMSKAKSKSGSPSRSRSESPVSTSRRGRTSGSRRSKKHSDPSVMFRSGSLRYAEPLSPLKEGPDPGGMNGCDLRKERKFVGQWMKGGGVSSSSSFPSSSCNSGKKGSGSDLRLLLGVLGVPLAPVHVDARGPLPNLCVKDALTLSPRPSLPVGTSSGQYILQQYVAASGAQKLQDSVSNVYVMGKVRMIASEFEISHKVGRNKTSTKITESGRFVLWQMYPDKWYVDLALGGSKVEAGCNGKLVWRHTPWLGPHAAKGPVRPLRRALQGLDPRNTAGLFLNATCAGEKKIDGEDCFVLKLCADPSTLKARSEKAAQIVRHVLFGYFSQKSGFLIHLEDSHLTRIRSNGGDVVHWETTINSYLEDYAYVDGVVIAHSGRSVASLVRFGETEKSHTRTRMEETWTIEEVAFNVPGLSAECFIPPSELKFSL